MHATIVINVNVYVEDAAFMIVKLYAGSMLDTMIRGNNPAKYARVTNRIVNALNTNPLPVWRARVKPQDTKKLRIANANATVANVLLNRSVYR